jgi:hypothetical protein
MIINRPDTLVRKLQKSFYAGLYFTALLLSANLYAATCPDEFGFYSRGTLRTGNNVSINGNAVPSNNGGSEDGINPNTGVLEVQSPLFNLPALNPSSFPNNNSNTDTSASTIAAGNYDEITVSDNTTTTFTGGTYNIDTLVVEEDATIILAPGIYYIDTLEMAEDSSLVISPSGSVQIYLGDAAEINEDVSINAGGAAGNLTINLYNNADFEANEDVTFNGVIYSPYNSSDIEFGENANITGGLVTNGKIELDDNSVLNYGTNEQTAVANVIPCTGALHHIEIQHDGSALTCEPESVTIRTCANTDCSSLYTADVNITFSPSGWLGGDTQTVTNGSGTLQFQNTSVGSVSLGINSSSPNPTNSTVCLNTTTGLNDCNLSFFDTGFIYTIPSQTSCTTSTAITISAVRLDDTSQACVPTFVSQTRDVVFSLNYVNPNSGTRSLTLNHNGTDYTPIDDSTSQTVPFSFDGNGQATFTINYADAGQISLASLYTGSAGTGDAGLSMAGSTTFVTRPAKLYVYADEANAACAGSLPTCSAFKRAGETFNLNVRGACSDNSVTPNFQLSGLTVSHTNTAPAITQGTLGTTSFDVVAGENGEHTISQTVSEVGAYTFTAELPVSGYFGETIGDATLNSSSVIGRFYPDHFCLSANSIVNRTDANTATGCSDGFSYLDEEFDVRFMLTAQAQNAVCTDGTLTQNYHAAWSKFSTPFTEDTSNATEQGKWNFAAVNDPGGTPVNLSSRISIDSATSSPAIFTNGTADITAKLNINRSGAAPAYTPEASFDDVRIGINPLDTDDVAIDTTDLTIASDTYREAGNTVLYFGRLFAENAFGTNQPDVGLDMYARTEFCNNVSGAVCTDWQQQTLDSCTLYNINPPPGVELGANPGSIGTPGYYLRASPTMTSSIFNFDDDGAAASYARLHVPDSNNHSAGWRLFYTAGGNGGDFTIPFRFPFNSDPTVHPYLLHMDGIASFGQFRGDDRIIFWREVLE